MEIFGNTLPKGVKNRFGKAEIILILGKEAYFKFLVLMPAEVFGLK
jgi:hypothetical protein